jgi:putative oxidoreductase
MTRTTWTDRGLLALRFALGIVFVMHGWQKIATYGLGGTAGFLAQVGVPLPTLSAVLIMTTEFVGGLALLAGLGTRVAAALLAFSMGVAIAAVHLANGFFLPTGFEYTFTLLLVNLAVVMTGAGAYSIDARAFRTREITDRVALKTAA